MSIPDEQVTLLQQFSDDGAELVLVAVRLEDDSIRTALRPVYAHPAGFGVMLAELVDHASNAYVKVGFDPTAVKNEILNALGESLEFPAARPVALQIASEEVPRG